MENLEQIKILLDHIKRGTTEEFTSTKVDEILTLLTKSNIEDFRTAWVVWG